MTPGPSKIPRTISPNDEPMDVDSSIRDFPNNKLTSIATKLRRRGWNDEGSNTAFDNERLAIIHTVVESSASSPESLVSVDQFLKNATKQSASGFINLLTKALKEKDLSFWRPVVTHGTSPDLRWTGLLTAHFSFLRRILRGDPR